MCSHGSIWDGENSRINVLLRTPKDLDAFILEKQMLKRDKVCIYKYEVFCVEKDNTFLWFEWVTHKSKDMILHGEEDWRFLIQSPTLGLCNSRYLP